MKLGTVMKLWPLVCEDPGSSRQLGRPPHASFKEVAVFLFPLGDQVVELVGGLAELLLVCGLRQVAPTYGVEVMEYPLGRA